MNYYDEILDMINSLLEAKEYDEAKRIILNELDMPYVPLDIETKLKMALDEIKHDSIVNNNLSDEDIASYLYQDENHQLLAINELNKRNLREYKSLVNEYLSSNGFKNAKVLLIDSLINQEINDEFNYKDNDVEYTFNPSNIKPIVDNDSYLVCLSKLNDIYMKEPSLLIMANQLLYKEAIMMLPKQLNNEDIDVLVVKITDFITSAFN